MPGETGPEASSQTLALERIDSVPLPQSTAQASKERMTEMLRRVREAASVRATASDAAIPKRAETSSSHLPRSFLESSKSLATAAQAAEAQSAPIELDRRAPEPATSLQPQKIEERIASWCIAVGTAVRGRWPDAVWDFYERMTDVATWWRMIKLVLKFFVRLLPTGHEPKPSRLSKAIKECFRDLHEPANSEAKKPDPNPR